MCAGKVARGPEKKWRQTKPQFPAAPGARTKKCPGGKGHRQGEGKAAGSRAMRARAGLGVNQIIITEANGKAQEWQERE